MLSGWFDSWCSEVDCSAVVGNWHGLVLSGWLLGSTSKVRDTSSFACQKSEVSPLSHGLEGYLYQGYITREGKRST